MAHTDILMFAEDPSAANYASLLLPALHNQGWGAQLYASAIACKWLRTHDAPFIEAEPGMDANALLRAVSPRCVLTGTAENPDTFGLKLIDAARHAGIPSAAFVDALMSAPYRFRGTSTDPLAHAPDRLLVPDQSTQDAFVDLGFRRDQVTICGHPQYDHTRSLAGRWASEGGPATMRRRLFPGVGLGKRILTFISEGALRYQLLPERKLAEYGFAGRGIDKGRTKIILEEVLDAIALMADKPHVVFRVHPIESAGDYTEYQVEINNFSSDGSPLELVYASDLTVGMTSMLLLEAALLGRPTLAVLARKEEIDLLPSVRAGTTRFVLDRASLRRELSLLLSASPQAGSPDTKDVVVAGSTERVVRILKSLI